MPKVHPLVYPTRPRDQDRPTRIFQQRDTTAIAELFDPLQERGFRYGEIIFNFPPSGVVRELSEEDDSVRSVDLSHLEPGDLILQATRPPLSDEQEGARKRVDRGRTDLEQRLLDLWGRYLEACSRPHVAISKALLKGSRWKRYGMKFLEGECAPYRELNDGRGWRKPERGTRRTAAFFLRVDEAWRGGPGYCCAFGMDGCSTLIWAWRLRHDFDRLFDAPGLTIVDIDCPEIPLCPDNLRFAADLRIDVVFSCPPVPLR